MDFNALFAQGHLRAIKHSHKQIHNSSDISTFSQVSHKTRTYANIKQNTCILKHKTFEELVPSVLLLVKGHTRLRHAGIIDHLVIHTRLKKNKKTKKYKQKRNEQVQ